jgi:hypothetical protein
VLGLMHAGLAAGLSAQAAGGSRSAGLTTAGLVIMMVSIGAILTLLVWCYSRVLRAHGSDGRGAAGKGAGR